MEVGSGIRKEKKRKENQMVDRGGRGEWKADTMRKPLLIYSI